MALSAVILLAIQLLLVGIFSFFAFFNYLYGFASLCRPSIRRVTPLNRRVAVVIVCFNERNVLEGTIRACEQLSYQNKLVLVADDSTDPEVVEQVREFARSRGCSKIDTATLFKMDSVREPSGDGPIEVWESDKFVLLHRSHNAGFKSGSLRRVADYLSARGVELMYLVDADWHPQIDTLERTLEVLEANERVAFVQAKRLSFPSGMNLFQKYVAIVEEGCYYVDFEGRQVLGHPILFSGCCALFRLDAVAAVGGFTAGHLTEDMDLTDRLWLSGWKGIYLSSVVNYGEVPFSYDHYRRQQERWAAGSARALRDFFWPLLTTDKLDWIEKLSALRQNAYFVSSLLTAFAIVLGIGTITWISQAWNSYAVECYLYLLGKVKIIFIILIYWCILSNFAEPVIMIVVKRKTYRDLLHLPMTIWYAWGVLLAYLIGNVKGLFKIKLDWFRTPKFLRTEVTDLARLPFSVRVLNGVVCAGLLLFYFVQGWSFGWFDEFSLLLVPAFILATVK